MHPSSWQMLPFINVKITYLNLFKLEFDINIVTTFQFLFVFIRYVFVQLLFCNCSIFS